MDGNKANATSGLWNVRVLLVLAIAVAGSIVGCEGLVPDMEDSEPTSRPTTPPVTPPTPTGKATLQIRPAIQQTRVWCWAAVSEMTLRHYRYGTINHVGDYQCGIVALLGGICDLNCYVCETGIPNIQSLAVILQRYQQIATRFGVGGRRFQERTGGRLSPNSIAHEIDSGRPVMAVINTSRAGIVYPPGFGEHISLIVGYRTQGGVFRVVVNDPFPYLLFGNDPFLNAGASLLRPGQYLINYEAFVSQLNYSYSISFS